MDFIARYILKGFSKFDEDRRGVFSFLSPYFRRNQLGSWYERSIYLKKVYQTKNGHKFHESEMFNCENILNTFVISDTHFLHWKIGEFCNRPIDWSDMIIRNWNSVVGEDDVVLHLGDLTFGNRDDTAEITRNLKGKKFLLRGNHDRRSKKWYNEVGFEVLGGGAFIVECEDKKILFSHRPIFDLPKKTINIHGHWHNKAHFMAIRQKCLYINVSVEKIDYTPIRINNLLYRKPVGESRITI